MSQEKRKRPAKASVHQRIDCLKQWLKTLKPKEVRVPLPELVNPNFKLR